MTASAPGYRLRRATQADVDALLTCFRDAHLRRWLFDDRLVECAQVEEHVAASEASFRSHGVGMWLLCAGDALAGFFSLRPGEPGEAELLYGLLPAHWHRGLATHCAARLVGDAFDAGGFVGVTAGADEPNRASIRVLERLGMERTGRELLPNGPTLFFALVRAQLREPGARRADVVFEDAGA